MLPSDFEPQSSLQTFHSTRHTRPDGMGAKPPDAAFMGVGSCAGEWGACCRGEVVV